MTGKTNTILKASVLLLIVSWYSRLLSAASVIVLARNLTKNDFGILAGCFIVQSFFTVLSNIGSGQYLIRKEIITGHDINAAWTINLFSKAVVALLIFSLSGMVANYMHIPEMALVLKFMSLSAIFIGLQNPAINIRIKNLDYAKLSILEVVAKSVSSTVSIVIAIIWKSYWAVIIGSVLYNFLYCIGSQIIVRHKLRLVWNNLNVQWQFSKWVLLKGIVNYIKVAFDKIIVGRLYSVGNLGLYNFATESSSTALQFVISPINKVLYPSLSEYLGDNQRLVDKVYKSITVLCCLYVPLVFGGAYLSDLIVPVVFGPQWVEAVPLFQAFLVMTLASMIVGVLTDVFTLTGEVKKQFYYETGTSVVFLIAILAVSSLTLYQFALCRMAIAYIMLAIIILTLNSIISLSIFKLCKIIFPFVLCSLIMLFTIHLVSRCFTSNVQVVNLIVLLFVGAVIYFISTLLCIIYIKRFYSEYDFLYKTFILALYQFARHKMKRNITRTVLK